MSHLVFRRAARRSLPLTPLLFILLISIGPATAAVVPQPGDFHGCPEAGQGGDPDLTRRRR
jgi:hypothetical protein